MCAKYNGDGVMQEQAVAELIRYVEGKWRDIESGDKRHKYLRDDAVRLFALVNQARGIRVGKLFIDFELPKGIDEHPAEKGVQLVLAQSNDAKELWQTDYERDGEVLCDVWYGVMEVLEEVSTVVKDILVRHGLPYHVAVREIN